MLEEMDLDAILAAPARSWCWSTSSPTPTPPGSRHPKRYLDVEELLAAGIDVYTTLNIQHVESLNDVVAQITRIRVRETVPDSRPRPRRRDRGHRPHARRADRSGCARARSTCREQARARARPLFLARQPDGAARAGAAAHRRARRRADARATCGRTPSPGPGPAGERVLVCVERAPARADAGPLCQAHRRPAAMRPGRRSMSRPPRTPALREAERDRIAETLRLAEQLGGEARHPAGPVASPRRSCAFARANNVTADRHRQVAALALVRAAARLGGRTTWSRSGRQHRRPGRCRRATRATRDRADPTARQRAARRPAPISGALTTARGDRRRQADRAGSSILPERRAGLRLPVLVARGALRPGAVALVVGAERRSAYNFFFLPPLYTFTIADPANVVGAGLLHGRGGRWPAISPRARAADRVGAARGAAPPRRSTPSAARSPASRRSTISCGPRPTRSRSMLKAEVVFLLPEDGTARRCAAAYPPEDQLDEADLARRAMVAGTHDQPAGRGSDTLPGAPLAVPADPHRPRRDRRGRHHARTRRAAARRPPSAGCSTRWSTRRRSPSSACSSPRHRPGAAAAPRRERLRSALLTSISHDLKTPLASIIGALVEPAQLSATRYDEPTREELLAHGHERGRAAGPLRRQSARHDPARGRRHRAQARAGRHRRRGRHGAAPRRPAAGRIARSTSTIAPDLPLLSLDFVLAEQVLVNLLDNAAKYTPGRRAHRDRRRGGPATASRSSCATRGRASPPRRSSASSTSSTASDDGDRRRAGTGLGLAICQRLRRGAWAARSRPQPRRTGGRRLHDRASRR